MVSERGQAMLMAFVTMPLNSQLMVQNLSNHLHQQHRWVILKDYQQLSHCSQKDYHLNVIEISNGHLLTGKRRIRTFFTIPFKVESNADDRAMFSPHKVEESSQGKHIPFPFETQLYRWSEQHFEAMEIPLNVFPD
ncbi:CLUMA_CG021582, isoform A [Clunio marinus]|uniref:CLUMA_CG021582, isoform A n=1 Tax=Clunio marinus TaxID=568069 RepID=A0A1J1J8Z8_9DIPT|nr:CLUMA_CG021582, isoform A [Clunio marinus]